MNKHHTLLLTALCVLALAGVARADYTTDILRDNPHLYWNFNESGTADAVDAVNGLAADNLAASGGANRAASITGLGNTATFDGVSGMFSATDLTGVSVPTQLWAAEFWFRVDGDRSGSRSDYLLEAAANDPAFIWDFDHGGGDTNQLELFRGPRTGAASPVIDDDEWHHAVFAFYGNDNNFGVTDRQDIWVDGQLVTSVSGIGFSSGFALAALAVGNANNGTVPFEGAIDELAIHDIGARLNGAIGDAEQNFEDLVADIAVHARIDVGPAVAATYTYNAAGQLPGGNVLYEDPGNTKLTDGIEGPAMFSSGTWAGVLDSPADDGIGQPIVEFDLTAATDRLDTVEIVYLVDIQGGVHAPDRVLVEFFSDAGLTSLVDSIESSGFINIDPNPVGDAGAVRSLMIDFANNTAGYARLTFFNDAEWTFLGEITFFEVPAPAALPAGLAFFGMIAMRRRR